MNSAQGGKFEISNDDDSALWQQSPIDSAYSQREAKLHRGKLFTGKYNTKEVYEKHTTATVFQGAVLEEIPLYDEQQTPPAGIM